MQKDPFAPGEWYHCYNRGTERRTIFHTPRDYERFLMLLYACNSTKVIHVSNIKKGKKGPTLSEILVLDRAEPLVTVASYALMPNHYHLLLRENAEGGITSFIRKVSTAYAMYYNLKRERSGTLFQGKFKARHVSENFYFRRVINYIHANPAELFEPEWKQGIVRNARSLEQSLTNYRFSSWSDYVGIDRLEARIIDKESALSFLETVPTFEHMLSEAQIFAQHPEVDRTKVGP
jgi:putative transposase